MKYMFLSLAAMAACFGLGRLLVIPIRKKLRPGHIRLKIAALTVLFGLLIFCGTGLAYLSVFYRADSASVEKAMNHPLVRVEAIEGGYFFDGPGDRAALVFYPGAKVDTLSYAPLMCRVAEQGVDCFLAEMPFHMAIFAGGAAQRFLDAYSYEIWATAGHSMGGIAAASFAVEHPEQIAGVILLASYPTAHLDARTAFCSIYGSEDGCLEMDAVDNSRSSWPKNSTEIRIEGGNHAQFGNYGIQRGDGAARLSADEQQQITADAICQLLLN